MSQSDDYLDRQSEANVIQPDDLAETTCPDCGDMFDSVPGTEVECPKCGARFMFDLKLSDLGDEEEDRRDE
jgi:DNA-directed RNA polymerase subunit RPC12/RpoP